jgi:hypothetical protein
LKVVFFDPFHQWDDVAAALRAFPDIEFAHPADTAALAAGLGGALSWPEVEKMIQSAYATPAATIDRAAKTIAGNEPR